MDYDASRPDEGSLIMANDTPTKPDWLTPEVLARIREIEYDLHVRAFGEEMARVNFMPIEERKRYLCEMIDHAVAKGVDFDRPAKGVK
jgi:hypothetical protein